MSEVLVPRVLHFVSGGFSGATGIAVQLCRHAARSGRSQAMLVLRRKRHTPIGRVEDLARQGLATELVPGWSHLATILALRRLCLQFRPDVLVAHGFSEHLWGRYAALAAGVPNLVMVEHNSRERYTAWRLAQAKWLARRTARIVACSEGVRDRLRALGMPAAKMVTIRNGIDTAGFADAPDHPYAQRVPGIVMVARFARQKDHATLLHAVGLLRRRGLRPPVLLVGGGDAALERAARRLATELDITDQVQFLGVRADVAQLTMGHQLCVLSTHYEGLPLALLEGMAAGCAVVASRVTGVEEVIDDGVDGRLVRPGDAAELAAVIADLLGDPARAADMAARGRHKATTMYSLDRMAGEYDLLFGQLASERRWRSP